MNVFIEGKTIHGHVHVVKCFKQTLSIIQNGKNNLIIKYPNLTRMLVDVHDPF
jgi:hypothetical protein